MRRRGTPAGLAGAILVVLVAAFLRQETPAVPAPRDRIEPAALLPPERLAAVAIGTSLTARALWPHALEATLSGCGFAAAEVTVRAEAGAGSAAGLGQVAAAGAGPYQVAFVEFAVNDADILDGITRAGSLANHRAIVEALRSRHPGIAVVLVTTNPVTGFQRLKRPRLMAYGDLYPLVAAEEGTSLFDGTARWRAQPPSRAALPDGLHPDPGVEAALYTRGLAALVAGIFGRSCPGSGAP